MCGIAGQIDRNETKIANLHDTYIKMQQSLQRRGPDQNGIYLEGNAALVHARLCVVDIENGLQPMRYTAGGQEYILVYNGELYNTDEVKKELISCGHTFRSHSDTEVLLHSYIEWKDKCVEKLNGIFAFAVLESKTGRLFLARDRIGVKPLFYTLLNGGIVFASEIKTLLCHPEIAPEIDAGGLAEIMFIGPGRTPGYGVFRNIKELLPAECGYYDLEKNTLKTRIYWKMTDGQHKDNFDQTVEKVRCLVLDSIERQLVSDVPVCTFLSGGLDSSIISSVADRYFTSRGERLQTVSVDYKDNEKYFKKSKFQPNSDPYFIGVMNDYLNANHHLILLDTPELVRALYTAVDARDLPGMADVDSSLLLFCKEIKGIATVALSGECADEIFGGYPWYRDKTIREKEGFPWAQSTGYRCEFVKPELLKGINPFEYVDARYRSTLDQCSILPNNNADNTRIKQMVNLNLRWFMQTLLDRKDRMSMYNGLEVRVPFCDYRIAEYLYTVPWEFKDYQGVEKGLLRQAMTGILPDEVLWRKKSPYPKTHNPSYLAAVSNELRQVIAQEDSPILNFIEKDALINLMQSDNPVPWYGQLMTTPQTIAYLLQFNYWLKKYNVRYV